MSDEHECGECGGPLAVREEMPEYLYERCTAGHHSLSVDDAIAGRWPGGINVQVAAKEPWPEGRWVRLMPLAEAEDE